MNFFVLAGGAPAAVALPPTPQVTLPPVPLARLALAAPALPQLPRPLLSPRVIVAESVAAGAPARELPRRGSAVAGDDGVAREGAVIGGRPGGGGGGGGAPETGAGTTGTGDYIFSASPRTTILPPLAQAPRSVAGRTYRVRFWVAVDGRVTRVEVDPPMPDGAYRREFLERMLAYQFHPARTRSGASVASVFTLSVQIGT